MPLIRLSRTVAVKVSHLKKRSPSGPYWFNRGVPKDLMSEIGKKTIQFSLKTHDIRVATRLAARHAEEQDRQWAELRSGSDSGVVDEAKRFLQSGGIDPADPKADPMALDVFFGLVEEELPAQVHQRHWEASELGYAVGHKDIDPHLSPVTRAALQIVQGRLGLLASQVRDEYVAAKTDDTQSVKSATLPFQYLIKLHGDKSIEKYTPQDVTAYVQYLLDGKHSAKGKGISRTTVTRYVTPLRAAWAMAMRRHGLKIDNVWAGSLDMPKTARGAKKRGSFTPADYERLFAAIGDVGRQDDLRCALVLLADTGARLAEIIGLRVSDCHVDALVPYTRIEEHGSRTVKTEHSERLVPLTPRALEAVRRALALADGSAYLFPRYTSEKGCKATYASNALSSWLRARGINLTCHSLRHGMRDRLRTADAPQDAVEQIQGWAKSAMSGRYGAGHSMERLRQWLEMATGSTDLRAEGLQRS